MDARFLPATAAPARGGAVPWLVGLAALTLLRLAVAAAAPLSPDEAYYWVWSRALAPGYLDHPPMVALWIRAGTLLAGPGPLGVRLLAPLSAALGTLLLARAAEDLLPGRGAGPLAGALLNATLLLGAGAVTMTPDTPLLFFWTAALAALARLQATGQGRWWIAAGLATGAALASKYTALLLPVSAGLWMAALPGPRRWLATPGPWLAALLGGLLFTPVLVWNAAHGWASFLKQGGRTASWDPARALRYLGELAGSQLGLATPLVLALCVAGTGTALRLAWRRRDPAASLLAALALVPAAVFGQHALGDRVQANWPAILYPAATIAAAGYARARWWRAACVLGYALAFLLYLQAAAAPFPLPRRLDITLIRLGGWERLAAAVQAARATDGAAFVAADEYGLAAELARNLPRDVAVVGAEPRWALFDLPRAGPALAGRAGLLLRSARRADAPSGQDWTSLTPLGTLTRSRGGVSAETYHLYRVRVAADAPDAVLLPRPRQGDRDAPAQP